MTEKSSNAARAVDIARGWIGTPYHHQASLKGVGTDCLGLVRGVYRELNGQEAEAPPAYSRDWGETGPREGLAIARAGPRERRQAGPVRGFSDRL